MFSIKVLVFSLEKGALKWSKAATSWANTYYYILFCSLLNVAVPSNFVIFDIGFALFNWLLKSLPALNVFIIFFYSFWVTSFMRRLFWADSLKAILFLISYINNVTKYIIYKSYRITCVACQYIGDYFCEGALRTIKKLKLDISVTHNSKFNIFALLSIKNWCRILVPN